jgi:hypothetical protein
MATSTAKGESAGFSPEERDAMKARAAELRMEGKKEPRRPTAYKLS